MALTPEQLVSLRSLPAGSIPNRVRLARNLSEPPLKQSDVAASTGFTSPQLSDIERGEYKDVPLENCRRLAEFFGCAIEDLFPPRDSDGDRRSGQDRRSGEERREVDEVEA